MVEVTAKQICKMLEDKHYDPLKSMIAFEVANGTGGASDRRADAVSMEFWPSNGLEITGYEIKVSRSDWLSELKQPDKSQVISQFCDKWYLIAPKGVLGVDELPKGWGYIQATSKSIRTKVRAPDRDPIKPDKYFMASLCRSMARKYNNDEFIKDIRKSIYDDCRKSSEERVQREMNDLKKRADEYRLIIDNFAETTGIHLSSWTHHKTANAIKFLSEDKNLTSHIRQMKRGKEVLEEQSVKYGKSIDALEDLLSSKQKREI